MLISQSSSKSYRIPSALLLFSAFFFLFNLFAFASRPDFLTWWTILPAWIPFVVTLLPTTVLLAVRNQSPIRRKASAVLWVSVVLALFTFSEESRFLFRQDSEAGSVRVLSLNWGGAGREPLLDLEHLKPDLILIQESPKQELLAEWCQSHNLHLVWSPEASVISQTPIELIHFDTEHVRVRWQQTEVVSLRLPPPLFRFDFWNPKCWSRYADRRRLRRNALTRLAQNHPSLLAGDFNCPANDGAISALRPDYVDAYAERGSGFPNTAPVYLPLHRIDQIWVDKTLSVCTCHRVKISGSDHYGVMTTLEVIQRTGSTANDKPV